MWSFFARDPLRDFQFDFDKNESTSCGIWRLHSGVKRGTGEEATIFVLADESQLDCAKANAKKLRVLRHPNVLKYLDSAESEKCVYIATEKVVPLMEYLRSSSITGKKKDLMLCWGIHQLMCGLSFVEKNGGGHWNLSPSSVFVTRGGEWKLGGFELVADGSSGVPVRPPSFRLSFSSGEPPELDSKPELRRFSKPSSYDAWCLGALIKDVFEKVPKQLQPAVARLTADNPGQRPAVSDVLGKFRSSNGYFDEPRVKALRDLETLSTASKEDAQLILGSLQKLMEEFPDDMCRFKVLPALMNAHEFGSAGIAALTTIFKYARLLEADDYTATVLPFVVRLFKSQDRSIRLRLLQNMDQFAPYLSSAAVNSDIFPNLVLGFQDTNPTIREHTIRALLTLAAKLNANNLNVEVMRHLARLQTRDDEGGIRTNTTICLGKLAQYLSPDTRRKILIPAFRRALKDPFPPARSAGILALSACQGYFYLNEVARGVIPALAPLTVDPEKTVRDEAFKAINGFVSKLEKVSGDPTLKETFEVDVNAAVGKDAASSGWAGWAMSALSNNLIKHIGSRKKSKGEAVAGGDASGNTALAGSDSQKSATSSAGKQSKEKSEDTEEEEVEDEGDGWEGIEDDELGGSPMNLTHSSSNPGAGGSGWGWDNDWTSSEHSAAKLGGQAKGEEEDLLASFGFAEKKKPPSPTRGAAAVNRERASAPKTQAMNSRGGDSWDSWGDAEGDGEWKDFDDTGSSRRAVGARKQAASTGERQPRLGARLGAKKLGND